MTFYNRIKPISYLKANAASVIRDLNKQEDPLIITQNGEAKAVLQNMSNFEQTQETIALLKILALGNTQIEVKKTQTASKAIKKIRNGIKNL